LPSQIVFKFKIFGNGVGFLAFYSTYILGDFILFLVLEVGIWDFIFNRVGLLALELIGGVAHWRHLSSSSLLL